MKRFFKNITNAFYQQQQPQEQPLSQDQIHLLNQVLLKLKYLKNKQIRKRFCDHARKSYQRKQILQQLKNSQFHYLQTLQIITTDLYEYLKNNQIMTQDQQKILFSNLNHIKTLHQKILQAANYFCQNWHPRQLQIVPILIDLVSDFQAYTDYFATHKKRLRILIKIRKEHRQKITDFIRHLKDKYKGIPRTFYALSQFFSVPVQRFYVYKQTVTNYGSKILRFYDEKYIDQQHPQVDSIKDLIEALDQVYRKVDQCKQQAQNIQIINNERLYEQENKDEEDFCNKCTRRYKLIQEWAKKQESYIKDMNVVVNQIQKPLMQNNLISDQEDKILFPNIVGIIKLSQHMHQTMKGFQDVFCPYKTEIAHEIIKLSNFYKIYIEYFNKFQKGDEILKRIKENQTFNSIESQVKKNKQNKIDIASYLIKPLQKLVSYELLIKEYRNNTFKDHPDYDALTRAKQSYSNVVTKTDQAKENRNYMKRLLEIKNKFKNILENQAQWRFQFQAWFEQEHKKCKVYVFTNLLLAIVSKPDERQQLIFKMILDRSIFVQTPIRSTQAKTHCISVFCGEEFGHFSFQKVSDRNFYYDKFNMLIKEIRQNHNGQLQGISKASNQTHASLRNNSQKFITENNQRQNKKVESTTESSDDLRETNQLSEQKLNPEKILERCLHSSIHSKGYKFYGKVDAYTQFSRRQRSAYVFSDRIIMQIQNLKDSLNSQIELLLDDNSYMRVCESRNSIRRKVIVYGLNQAMIFQFYELQKKQNFTKNINRALQGLKRRSVRKQSEQQRKKRLKLQVVGIEKRLFHQFIVIKIQPIDSVMTQIAFIKVQEIYNLEQEILTKLQSKTLDQSQQLETSNWNQLRSKHHQSLDMVKIKIEKSQIIRCWALQTLFLKIQVFLNSIFCKGMQGFVPLLLQRFKVFELLKQSLSQQQQISLFMKTNSKPFKSHLPKIKPQKQVVPTCSQVIEQLQRILDQTTPPLDTVSKFGIPETIQVHLPDYREPKPGVESSKKLQVSIFDEDTVGSLLNLIKKKLQLKYINDYGLLILVRDSSTLKQFATHLHPHEFINDIINEYDIILPEQKIPQSEGSFLTGFYNKVRHSLSLNPYKKPTNFQTTLQLRKIFVFPTQVESIACHRDPNRYQLLCEEIFYLFKTRKIFLSNYKTAEFCALYICIRYLNHLSDLLRHQVKLNLFQEVLPQNLINLVNQGFEQKVWKVIRNFKVKKSLEKEMFMNQLIALVIDNQGFNTQFFMVQNPGPHYFLDAKDKHLMIGLNWQSLVVVRVNSSNLNLCSIKLHELKINFIGYLIRIEFQENIYQYSCQEIWSFKHMLQMYMAYNRRYLKRVTQFSFISENLLALLA